MRKGYGEDWLNSEQNPERSAATKMPKVQNAGKLILYHEKAALL